MPRQNEDPPAAGPSDVVKGRLKRLPQPFDIWQADRRRLATLVEHEGRLIQPWTILVARGSNRLLAQAIGLEPPSAARAGTSWPAL
jgi:hypothetical protein